MRKVILKNNEYSFDPANKQVSILEYKSYMTGENLLLITNTTDNKIIYNFGCEGFGGIIETGFARVTLEHDTTSMSAADSLQIIIAVDESEVNGNLNHLTELEAITNIGETLECIKELLETNNKLLKKILS